LPWNITWNILWNISDIFKKFHDVFSGFTLTSLTFLICQTLPFIHLCILHLPKPYLLGLLVYGKSFHTISKYFAGWSTMQAVLCIVQCNKLSKPVKGKYLLLCMNSIMYLLLTWYTLIMFLKVLSHLILKIKSFMKYFKKGVLKYFKIFIKFFKHFKVKYFIVHFYCPHILGSWSTHSFTSVQILGQI